MRVELIQWWAAQAGHVRPGRLPVGEGTSADGADLRGVIDSGTRQIVHCPKRRRFEPGGQGWGAQRRPIEVLDGVKAAKVVVVAANFLIDAESNLKRPRSAALGAIQGAPKPASVTGSACTASQAWVTVAEGTVDSVDARDGTVSLSHGPVPSPQMAGHDHGVRSPTRRCSPG